MMGLLIFVIKKYLLSKEDSVPPKEVINQFSQEIAAQKEEESHHE